MAIKNNCSLCWPTVIDCNPCATPSDPCPSNCIYAPSIVISEDNSVDPCGETGQIPFENLTFGLSICEDDPITYSIVSHSVEVENVSIDEDGITFTSTNAAADTLKATLVYKVSCSSYATLANVTIIFKNPCINVMCSSSEDCNRCTGNCEPAEVDISLSTDDTPNVNIKLS